MNRALAVGRPRVPWEGQRRTVLHPLEFAAVLTAARRDGDTARALVALVALLGLRVSEACNADIADLRDVDASPAWPSADTLRTWPGHVMRLQAS